MAISSENHLDRRWFLLLALKMEQYELRSPEAGKRAKRGKRALLRALLLGRKKTIFFYIYDVIVKQRKKTLHYSLLLCSHVYYSLFAHTCGLRA